MATTSVCADGGESVVWIEESCKRTFMCDRENGGMGFCRAKKNIHTLNWIQMFTETKAKEVKEKKRRTSSNIISYVIGWSLFRSLLFLMWQINYA